MKLNSGYNMSSNLNGEKKKKRKNLNGATLRVTRQWESMSNTYIIGLFEQARELSQASGNYVQIVKVSSIWKKD